jgi:hypothetical protein
VFMVALVLVAASFALLSDGYVVAGICTMLVALPVVWLGGVWALPWSVDRYVLRVSEVLQTGSREANTASRARRASLHKLRRQIEEVKPPSDWGSIHQMVTDRMREIDGVEEGDRSEPIADRAMRMYALRGDLIAALERLSACHADRQVTELAQLVDQVVRDVADTRRTTEVSIEDMSERLRKIAVPRGWRDKHSQCESAVSVYLSALKCFDDAWESDSPDTIRRAAQELALQQAAMEAYAGEYVDELRSYYQGQDSRHFETRSQNRS